MEKSVVTAIKNGHTDQQIVNMVKNWAHVPDPKLSEIWDIRIGNMMWTRCVSGDICDEKEVEILLQLFHVVLGKYMKATDEFVLRLKTISVLLKFFIAKNKMVLTDLGDKILNYLSSNYEFVAENDKPEFNLTMCTFYGVIWNMMRENVSKLSDLVSLQLVSQSIQFLSYNLPDKLETVAGKLYQCNSIVLGCKKKQTVISFLENLVNSVASINKQVINKGGAALQNMKLSHYEAFYQIVFTVARYLIANSEITKARKLCSTLISSVKNCLASDIFDAVNNLVELYIKVNEFIVLPKNVSATLGSDLTNFISSKLNADFEIINEGHRLILLYTFGESVWHCMLHAFKKTDFVTCNDTESEAFENFIEGFKNFGFSLELLPVKSYEGTLIGKRQEIEISLLMLPMRFYSDRVNKKEAEVTENMCAIVEACYTKVISVCESMPKSNIKVIADNYNRMCHCSSQIAFGYQKRKLYTNALSWCQKGKMSLQALNETDDSFESAINPSTLSVLIADCNRHMEKPEEGLRSLSVMLTKDKSLLESPSPTYDLYETLAWNDWNNHWNQLKRDLHRQNPKQTTKTVVDYLKEEKDIHISLKFRQNLLRHELNSYFTNRQVIPEAMFSVGKQIADCKGNFEDKVLGLLSQIVAKWWSDDSEIDSAILLCKEALEIVHTAHKLQTENQTTKGSNILTSSEEEYADTEDQKKTKKSGKFVNDDEIKRNCRTEKSKDAKCCSILLLSSIVRAWTGLCIWRKNTGIAEHDVTEYYDICEQRREKIRKEGMDEEEACAESDHAYVGNTQLTIEDEMTVVTYFLKAVNQLYLLIQTGDTVKQLFDATCPALIMCTSRLVSHMMLTFGHTLYAIKSWQVTYFLAKIYDRKGLTVLCASELLKLVCNPDADYVQEANEINENAKSCNLIKNYKGLYYRLHLAHAIACHHNKSYAKGAVHLSKVLKETEMLENEQFTVFVRGEALLVFAWYKRSAATNDFQLSDVYDVHLMSPCDLYEDGYRTLTELSRDIDIINSGWTDMYHNCLLVSTLLHHSDKIISYFQEVGLQFEVRSAATEIVNQALSFGCVSRAVQMLTYLSMEDLVGKSFNHCIAKFDIINKSMQKKFPHFAADSPGKIKQFIAAKLSMPDLKVKKLEENKELSWNLKLIQTNEETSDDELSNSNEEDIQLLSFTPQPFRPYSFFAHPLNCYCYICTHPYIIPDALKFLHLQAKYSIGNNKRKLCLVIFELAKRYHLRSMFRLMYNCDLICEKMLLNKKDAPSAYKATYYRFFTEPAFHRLGLQMESTSSEHLENLVYSMDEYNGLLNLKDPNDLVAFSIPYEILCSAIINTVDVTVRTNSMCRCSPLVSCEEVNIESEDSKTKELGREKVEEIGKLVEELCLEKKEDRNCIRKRKEAAASETPDFEQLDTSDEKFLLKLTKMYSYLNLSGDNSKDSQNKEGKLYTDTKEKEIIPESPEEIAPSPPEKVEMPKIPKKGLKKCTVQNKEAHNLFAKSKAFTVYEDFEPIHPKPIPFSVPLVDLEISDHEKENDEEVDNKKYVTVRKPRRVTRPERTRGKDTGSTSKKGDDDRVRK